VYPRERQQYAFGAVVLIVALLNLAFFFLFFAPTRNGVRDVAEDIARLEAESVARALRVDRLESMDGQLDTAQSERLGFLSARVIPRRDGFAALIQEKERQAQFAGLTPQRVTYELTEQPQFGMHAVYINMPLQGDYESLTRFIQALEESETFFIMDSMNLARFDPDQPGELNMLLNFTTFFYAQ
jgi:Tfp pilus assembly protein PilO